MTQNYEAQSTPIVLRGQLLDKAMAHLRAAEPRLAGAMDAGRPFPKVSGRAEFSEFCRAVIGQQLSTLVADRIWERFTLRFGNGAVEADPRRVLNGHETNFREVGLSTAKRETVRRLAAYWIEEGLSGEVLARQSDAELMTRFTQLKGIGPWTVRMVLIFSLGRADVLPVEDLGVRAAIRLLDGSDGLPPPKALSARCEPWRPYATLGTWYCWELLALEKKKKAPVENTGA